MPERVAALDSLPGIFTAASRSTDTSCETPRSAMVTPNSRFMRAMVIGLCVMMTKRVSVEPRHLVEQVAEAVDVVIVERRVHFVQHADRRRIGQEHRKDQRQRGQRLLAAGQQRQRRRLLPGRLGQNFEPGFERVVAFDQLQFGGAAAEQLGEQVLEVLVDLFERGQQPLARLAVEALDALAQVLDRLDQVVALGGQDACWASTSRSSSSARRLTAPSRSRSRRSRSSVASISARSGSGVVGFDLGELRNRRRRDLQHLADFVRRHRRAGAWRPRNAPRRGPGPRARRWRLRAQRAHRGRPPRARSRPRCRRSAQARRSASADCTR